MVRRHYIVYALIVAAVFGAGLGGAYSLPALHGLHNTKVVIDPKSYGHVQPYDGYMLVTLAPNSDLSLRRWELGLGRVMFTSAGIAVSDDGKRFYPVQGGPQTDCLYHWQGAGINAVATIGKCVPGWATVTGDPENHHAAEWVRIENLSPTPRVVLLKYS